MFSFIPLLVGLGATLASRYLSKQQTSSVTGTPSMASPSVLLAEDRVRQAARKKKGRASTNITGGLQGNPTLGQPALWGV